MLVKVIIIFLLIMVLIGMVGKFLFPNAMPRLGRTLKTCPNCRRQMVGRSCSCKEKS